MHVKKTREDLGTAKLKRLARRDTIEAPETAANCGGSKPITRAVHCPPTAQGLLGHFASISPFCCLLLCSTQQSLGTQLNPRLPPRRAQHSVLQTLNVLELRGVRILARHHTQRRAPPSQQSRIHLQDRTSTCLVCALQQAQWHADIVNTRVGH